MALEIALHVIVLVAAIFQTVTGLGFAMIAGPVILMVANDTAAVQTSIMLNVLISGILVPQMYRHADPKLLVHIAIGTLAGLPVGIVLFQWIDLNTLKLASGIMVGGMAALMISSSISTRFSMRRTFAGAFWAGGVSGVLTALLAMPGPMIATYMGLVGGYSKQTIRATILTYFVLAYASALLIHFYSVGIQEETFMKTLSLAPATVIGIGLGALVVKRVDEKLFNVLVTSALVATSAALIADIVF